MINIEERLRCEFFLDGFIVMSLSYYFTLSNLQAKSSPSWSPHW